ncbi:hypothetical protein PYCCODRAFT_1439253 [Trametes coccinea BRFM310]|uniref:Uncharacterized protein n=1 Tax=Trametes coccinea (strain BRFM310) TaxID=1353009 RepID=A0A1Y2IB88_TRAC3|nr:hypothetical protein PYCCODRAFT_1439253 [Trametes coccinea BRFM310]
MNDARLNATAGTIKLAGAMLTLESIESPTAEKKMVRWCSYAMPKVCSTSVPDLFTRDVYYTSGVSVQDKLVICLRTNFSPATPHSGPMSHECSSRLGKVLT